MKYLFKLNQYNQQRQRENKRWIYPIKLAMYATHLRNQNHKVYWDVDTKDYNKIITSEDQINVPFLDLPAPDRVLTDAKNPKWQDNGNFKFRPATYIQVADGCSWGKCAFCVEKGRGYEVRDVEDAYLEVLDCQINGFREIFDDSGTFPDGEWRGLFCEYVKYLDIKLGCNLRVEDQDFKMLADAGFRMVLFGVESASQDTLDRINKGVSHAKTEKIIKEASKAGLEPHITVMVGYPWETLKESYQTIRYARRLLCKGYARTAQVSVYDVWGYRANDKFHRVPQSIYKVGFSPRFWYNQIKNCKSKEDWQYILRSIKKGLNV